MAHTRKRSLHLFRVIFTARPTREAPALCFHPAVALCFNSRRRRTPVTIGLSPRSTNFRAVPTDQDRCRRFLLIRRAVSLAQQTPVGILPARASFTTAAEPCTS